MDYRIHRRGDRARLIFAAISALAKGVARSALKAKVVIGDLQAGSIRRKRKRRPLRHHALVRQRLSARLIEWPASPIRLIFWREVSEEVPLTRRCRPAFD